MPSELQPLSNPLEGTNRKPKMELDELRRKWEYLGEQDPLWAILTDEDKRGSRWDLDEFLESGNHDAAGFLELAKHLLPALHLDRGLDFGCGVGRLTLGHAPKFRRMDGVDISRPMIERARALNPFDDRVRFHVNTKDDLSLFEDDSFDYIISHIVLQHVPPAIHMRYVGEFVRILKPGGVAIFQLPDPVAADWGSEVLSDENIEKIDMYGSPQENVLAAIQDRGGRILQARPDSSCGPDIPSFRYAFSK